MTLLDLSKHLETIITIGTHKILLNDRIQLNIKNKGFQDIVTAKDRLMEDYLVKEILKHCPNDLFIAEEGHHHALTAKRTWIIDPIDGTLNFTKEMPYYGVQLALIENYKPMLSIIFLPALQEFYCAIFNHGASLNSSPLHLNSSITIENAIITFGDFSKSNPGSRDFQVKMIGALHSKASKIRIQGSSSIDFAFVAGSKTHAHIMFSKRIWEIEPGLMLLKEAGASTAVIPGETYGFTGHAIIACANQNIMDDILLSMKTFKL